MSSQNSEATPVKESRSIHGHVDLPCNAVEEWIQPCRIAHGTKIANHSPSDSKTDGTLPPKQEKTEEEGEKDERQDEAKF